MSVADRYRSHHVSGHGRFAPSYCTVPPMRMMTRALGVPYLKTTCTSFSCAEGSIALLPNRWLSHLETGRCAYMYVAAVATGHRLRQGVRHMTRGATACKCNSPEEGASQVCQAADAPGLHYRFHATGIFALQALLCQLCSSINVYH